VCDEAPSHPSTTGTSSSSSSSSLACNRLSIANALRMSLSFSLLIRSLCIQIYPTAGEKERKREQGQNLLESILLGYS